MPTYYVLEHQEIGPGLRIPIQFSSPEEASVWVTTRKMLPAYKDVTYTLHPDDPDANKEQYENFTSA